MRTVFFTILEMSLTAAFLILVLTAFRPVLKKFPVLFIAMLMTNPFTEETGDSANMSEKGEFASINSGAYVRTLENRDGDGNLVAISQYTRDDSGNELTCRESHVDGTFCWWNEYRYDSENNPVEYVRYKEDGSIYYTWESRFNDLGNEIERICSDSSGKELWSQIFGYNNENELIYTEKYSSEGKLESRTDGKTTSEKATDKNRAEHFSSKEVSEDVSDKVSLKGSKIYFENHQIGEFEALAEGKAASDDVDLRATEKTVNGVTYLVIRAYYQLDVPAPYTPVEVYNYMKSGSEYKCISSDSEVINAGKTDTDVYIEVRYRSGFKSYLYNYSVVYKMDSAGNIVCLNGLSPLFTDYHSISLIGTAKNKAYLKCLWDPEANNGTALEDNSIEEHVSVSPVKDGFFTYDGKNLKQIHKYVFSSDEVVSENGDVYIVNNYRGILKKLNRG